jgi:hypothetical protein
MSETPNFPPGDGGNTGFTTYYVMIGAAALFPTVFFLVAFALIFRHYKRRSPSLERELPPDGAPGDVFVGRKSLGEKPKLFEVHVKPGLAAGEAKFEDILVSLD